MYNKHMEDEHMLNFKYSYYGPHEYSFLTHTQKHKMLKHKDIILIS